MRYILFTPVSPFSLSNCRPGPFLSSFAGTKSTLWDLGDCYLQATNARAYKMFTIFDFHHLVFYGRGRKNVFFWHIRKSEQVGSNVCVCMCVGWGTWSIAAGHRRGTRSTHTGEGKKQKKLESHTYGCRIQVPALFVFLIGSNPFFAHQSARAISKIGNFEVLILRGRNKSILLR